MRIKKFLTMTMVTIMVAGLTACGGSEGSTNETTTTPVASEENQTTGNEEETSSTSTVETREAGCYDADGNLVVTWDEAVEDKFDANTNDKLFSTVEIVCPDDMSNVKFGTEIQPLYICGCNIVIPSTVKAIPEAMFAETGVITMYSDLVTVKFEGTVEQWNNLDQGKDNRGLNSLTIQCTDGIAKYTEPQEETTTLTENTTETSTIDITAGEVYELCSNTVKALSNKDASVKVAYEEGCTLDELINKGYISDAFELKECYTSFYKTGDEYMIINVPVSNNCWINLTVVYSHESNKWIVDSTGVCLYGNKTLLEIDQITYGADMHMTFDASNGTAYVEEVTLDEE